MDSQNIRAGVRADDLSLTMVELALAQSNLSGCEVAGGLSGGLLLGGGDASSADDRMFDLDIGDVCGQADLVRTLPVTYSPLSYVTHQPEPTPRSAFDQYLQHTLQFDLDCLSGVEHQHDRTLASKDPPVSALSGSNSDDYLLLDCAAGGMPSSEIAAGASGAVADKAAEIGRRKKTVPRRRSQPPANNRDPPTATTLTAALSEKPIDDLSRLAEYVPACLDRYVWGCESRNFPWKISGNLIQLYGNFPRELLNGWFCCF